MNLPQHKPTQDLNKILSARKAFWWQVYYIGFLLPWRQPFILTRISIYFGYGFFFLAYRAFANTLSKDIRVSLCDVQHRILHNNTKDQVINFTPKEIYQWTHVHGCHITYETTPRLTSWPSCGTNLEMWV